MNDSSVKNLADVKALLPRVYSKSSVPVYESAFNRVERLTKRRLQTLPADRTAWDNIAGGIVWAGEFKSRIAGREERAFRDWCSKIGGAIDKAHEFLSLGEPIETSIMEAWHAVLAYVASVEGKRREDGSMILPQQASLSFKTLHSRLGRVHPAQIDHKIASDVLAEIPPGRVTSFRRSIRFMNKVIVEQESHPGLVGLLPTAPIPPLATLRDEAFAWEACEPSLVSSVSEAIETAIFGKRGRPDKDRFAGRLGPDRLADRRKAKLERKKPIRNPAAVRKNHRAALSWLARFGFATRDEVYEMCNLRELLTAESVERAATTYVERSAGSTARRPVQETSSLNTYLSSLAKLSRANDLREEVAETIEDVPFLLSSDGRWHDNSDRMSREREKFLKTIDRDKAKVLAIVRGPRVLAAEARRALDRWDELGKHQRTRALHICIAAAAMAMQVARASRTKNVNDMTSAGDNPELLPPARAGEKAWVDIPRDHVKNRRPIEHPLPDWSWDILKLWLERGRPLWIEHNNREAQGSVQYRAVDNDYLFPGVGREGALSRGTFGKAWNLGVQEFLGLRGLTTHVMRHVNVTIFLARFPGMYGAAASLIGDRERAVEAFYARGAGREAAALFASVLSEIDPLLDLNSTFTEGRPVDATKT